MKETHYFYAPDIAATFALPNDEASHAVRVLRMTEGDELWAMDGRGTFYRCEVSIATRNICAVNIIETLPQNRSWRDILTLAVAPTKNMDRLEWLTEKAVEIGVDRIVPLMCHNSERVTVKTERLERIVTSAMKQSRKPWRTEILPMISTTDFMKSASGHRYMAHCREDVGLPKPFLLDVLPSDGDVTVMIGPEGDFSSEEVKQAIALGFVPVSLGNSRLRTETAGLAAVHLMQISHAMNNHE